MKPTAPISTLAHPFENMDTYQTEADWVPHKQLGDENVDFPHRPGHRLLTSGEHAKLYRIVHETILVYCGSRGKVTPQGLAGLYERYLSWMEKLPTELKIDDSDPLPHVLFLQ